jgi:hypothetical protein
MSAPEPRRMNPKRRLVIIALSALLFPVSTFLFRAETHAGGFAKDSEQKCLELTRIAANSMLTPADEEFCQVFGRVMENKTGVHEEVEHGTPATIPRADLIALINKFLLLNPTYANEPLAAKTMYAVTAQISDQWNWPVDVPKK